MQTIVKTKEPIKTDRHDKENNANDSEDKGTN